MQNVLVDYDKRHKEKKKKRKIASKKYKYNVYLFSTSRKCIAAYANTMKLAPKTASPIASDFKAPLLKPKELKMAAPGTSISRPYLWSIKLKVRTSLTIRPSKPKWNIESWRVSD